MKLKTVLTFIYLFISAILFVFFKAEIIIWASFFINFLLITGIAYYHLNIEKIFSPFLAAFVVFFYLFTLVAPIVQISLFDAEITVFPNNYPYNTMDVIFANMLIFIFVSIFFIFYIYFKSKNKFQVKKRAFHTTSFSTPLTMLILFIICISIFVMNYEYIIEDIGQSVYFKNEESVSSLLLKRKVLFYIPIGAIVFTYTYLKHRSKITTNTLVAFCILTCLFLILFFLKNPFTEKRNALGPIYITLTYLFIPKLLNSNAKFFLFLFLSMVIAFPLMSTLTHIDASLEEIIANPKLIVDSYLRFGGITNAFRTLHYDAFANIMATVDYVKINGFSFGYQLLGTLLFFLPRSLWVSKPLSTGELIGNHVIEKHNFVYSNLSNPIVSEGYINFGIIGTIAMAITLAYVITIFIKWMNTRDDLKKIIAFYFAVHLIFFLRGDITNGFSYFVGPLFAVLFIPKAIDYMVRVSLKKKKQ